MQYSPTPYSRVTATGQHVGPAQVAQTAADYLRGVHGGTSVPPFTHALPLQDTPSAAEQPTVEQCDTTTFTF
eukprot:941103-Prorocentrum_lima.AAC.1